MDDTTVLQQLWIEEYAQELSLKGKLHFCLKKKKMEALRRLIQSVIGSVLH